MSGGSLGQRLRELCCRARFYCRPRPAYRRELRPEPVLRGNMQNVLVIKPDSEVFSQAIFIMKEDFLRQSGVTRQELLLQARAAADDYLTQCGMTRRPRRVPLFLILLPPLAAAAAIIIYLL